MSQEYYKNLSLPPIPHKHRENISKPRNTQTDYEAEIRTYITLLDNDELQHKLKNTFDKLIMSWSAKHDSLIDTLIGLEQSNKTLKHRLSSQTAQCKKSQKDAAGYKARYEQLMFQRRSSNSSQIDYNRRKTSLISSNVSCLSGTSYTTATNSSASIRSSSSSYTQLSQLTDMVDYTAGSSLSSSAAASTIFQDDQEISDNDATILKFGCGDGFWNTIAKSKNNKKEVEELISKFLQRGGNPNVAKNSETVKNVKEGYGLIHAVVAVKNTAALQKILDAGAKPNVLPLTNVLEDRIHPLVLAAKLSYMSGVKMLIERGGAHVLESRGPLGESVLHAAVQSDSDEMVAYLLRISQRKLLEITDNAGATPLHYASISGRTRLIELFIKGWDAQCDPRDSKGETPLHYAVRHRKSKVIMKLVGDLGADPNPYVFKQVPTPLELAKSGGLKTISEYLKQKGGKTSKEIEKSSKTTSSSAGSMMSGGSNSSGSSGSGSSHESSTGQSTTLGVRHYLHTKTSQILRGSF
ncbi:ankyrin [Backusella circina FSU 941]|nr:ankyrin [Backusella circina FSU 941]